MFFLSNRFFSAADINFHIIRMILKSYFRYSKKKIHSFVIVFHPAMEKGRYQEKLDTMIPSTFQGFIIKNDS